MSKQFFSRRELLRAGLAGAALAATPAAALPPTEAELPILGNQAAGAVTQGTLPVRKLETLSATEAGTLEAIVARLIPTDANGPGAAEAGVAHYIDRALGGALASSRPAYAAGLAAVEQYAMTAKGAPFTRLSAQDQDALLTNIEAGAGEGFLPPSADFFTMVRDHTLQGMFCDPYYGGNANFVGWDLLGYPGVRTMATPEQQRMGAKIAPNHKSAYDYEMFTKASAQVVLREDEHGD